MHPALRQFAAQLALAVLAALAPVVFAAFVTLPWTLQGHPGESRAIAADAPTRHLT